MAENLDAAGNLTVATLSANENRELLRPFSNLGESGIPEICV